MKREKLMIVKHLTARIGLVANHIARDVMIFK